MILGRRAALRIYVNQTTHPHPLWPLLQHPNFMSTYRGLMPVKHSVLNVKALLAIRRFQPGKGPCILVGAFSVIVQIHRLIDFRH